MLIVSPRKTSDWVGFPGAFGCSYFLSFIFGSICFWGLISTPLILKHSTLNANCWIRSITRTTPTFKVTQKQKQPAYHVVHSTQYAGYSFHLLLVPQHPIFQFNKFSIKDFLQHLSAWYPLQSSDLRRFHYAESGLVMILIKRNEWFNVRLGIGKCPVWFFF